MSDTLTRTAWEQLTAKNGDLCDEWKDFDNFLAGAGPRTAKEYRLVKVNPAAKYEPGNTKWILGSGMFDIGGTVYALSHPGRDGIRALEDWIKDNRISPLEIAKKHLEGLTAEQQQILLKEAFSRERLFSSSISEEEFGQAADSREGAGILAFHMLKRKHPEITQERAEGLVMELSEQEFEKFMRARDSLLDDSQLPDVITP